jgi:phenylalanyl-tRNA synthetase beta chain
MKFTLSWLKDHLDTTSSIDEIAKTLTHLGLEVESIDDPSTRLGVFTIARVLDVKQHPNADRLRVCRVETGTGVVEVVCGAENAKTGMIGVFAPIGSYIPGTKLTLEKRAVRGVVSNGMLVSERELELSDDHAGIIELDSGMGEHVGDRFIDAVGLNDPVIEVKLTPNRPDCTGVRGIARDLAAVGLGTLKSAAVIEGVEGKDPCPIEIKLEFPADAASACSCFAGRYIKGIENGPSPAWLQRRLRAIGQRPINAVVDVTNFITIDRGRPLHVYDADKLQGAIRARLGKFGESFLGLDGKEYAVDETMCVIADDGRVLGLGGILGGEATACTLATRNILIECAYFDPLRTATTGRKAGIQTDARYRFERGVDPAFVLPGLDLATAMILEVARGVPSKAKVAGEPPIKQAVVAFNFDRVEKLTGLRLPDANIRTKLVALGFRIEGEGPTFQVRVPSWRPDVQGTADLVEEVTRLAGLETIPSTPFAPDRGVARPVLTDLQRRARQSRRSLASRGFVEAITWSFIARSQAAQFGGGSDTLELANPISSEMSSMRPSLIPGLLAAVQRNRNRGIEDMALFEVGQAYRGDRPEDQFIVATGVRAGAAQLTGLGRHWLAASSQANVFDVKADIIAVFAALGFDASRAQLTRDAPYWFHPGRSGTLRLGPKIVLAQFGEIHPETLSVLDVAAPAAAFELFLESVPIERKKVRARPPLHASDLLPVRRDFAFVVDQNVAAGDVIRAALGADKALISSVDVFDVFQDASLGQGKKSIAIEVTLQPNTKTLTDAQIEAVARKVVAEVKRATGGEIRGVDRAV